MKFPSEVKLLGVINYIYKCTPIYVGPLIISGFVLVKMAIAKFIKICTYAIVLEYENPKYSFLFVFHFMQLIPGGGCPLFQVQNCLKC